ncbi:hypothetical protein ACROYT_G013108 [Oculina patagonica]
MRVLDIKIYKLQFHDSKKKKQPSSISEAHTVKYYRSCFTVLLGNDSLLTLFFNSESGVSFIRTGDKVLRCATELEERRSAIVRRLGRNVSILGISWTTIICALLSSLWMLVGR